MSVELAGPRFDFPKDFCCNCGDPNCVVELQDTRVTKYVGVGGVETTFELPIPVCAPCRKSTKRRPTSWFRRLLVLALATAVVFLALVLLASSLALPVFLGEHLFTTSVVVAVIFCAVLWRLRQPIKPQTSYYQPVRIKSVNVQVTDVMAGAGQVARIEFRFTNPAYLELFKQANQAAIAAKYLIARKA
jgi:hypothetical protein